MKFVTYSTLENNETKFGFKSNEIAVMIDTFKPLKITTNVIEIDDSHYPLSRLDNS